jgi:glyoxylase-like metal-dependent hydrolase (beta-lactamase superfamily II)
MSDVVALLDAEGSFATFREAFRVDDDERWRLPFHVFLVRDGDSTVLVDTGVGPPDGADPFLPERQGRLPDELARVGVRPEDVDLVVLTHLHVDHVGWNMRGGSPFFPNARYVAHEEDYAWVASTRLNRPYVRENVFALYEAGRLELVQGPWRVGDVELIPMPGHTPGHCIADAGDVTLLGDLAVHELQLADPDLAYVGEEDAGAAAEQRRRLLPGLATSGRIVGLAHLGLGRVVAAGEGFGWRPSN